MKKFEIIKVNRYFKAGAKVTIQKTLKHNAELKEVLEIAKRQKADIDEVLDDLEVFGITSFKGYMVSEI